jgi:hypothetical protein
MSINKKVFYALGNPEYIHFWWSESQKVLLISEAPENNPLSIKIKDCYYTTKNGFKIERNNFVQVIMKIAGWRPDIIYAVTGEYIVELDMVAFKLNNAEELEVEPEMAVDSNE